MRIEKKNVLKYAVLCVAMAAIGFGAACCLYRNAPDAKDVSAEISNLNQAYTTEQFRTERQQLRALQKAQINDIIYGEGTDSELVDRARTMLLELLEREETENVLEGLLKIRGFEGAIVSVRSDSASVFIVKDMLTQQESSIILDLVCRETGLLSGNIKIIPIN